jgi:hypothetical protein
MELDFSQLEGVNWVVNAIDESWATRDPEPERTYIGASGIGDECEAYQAFSLRGFPGTDPDKPNVLRIFRDGHRIEDEVVADLRKAGIEVLEVDPDTGKQFNYSAAGGHIQGNADGKVNLGSIPNLGLDVWAILEIKSMNEKKWKEFKGKGVRISHPKYYSQMQFLMGFDGELKHALLVAYNKNTSEYWAQVVEFDELHFALLLARAEAASNTRPERISNKGINGWPCRFCFKKDACWNPSLEIPQVCRTCTHSEPTDDGGWYCGLHDHHAHLPCGDWERWVPLDKPHPKGDPLSV